MRGTWGPFKEGEVLLWLLVLVVYYGMPNDSSYFICILQVQPDKSCCLLSLRVLESTIQKEGVFQATFIWEGAALITFALIA